MEILIVGSFLFMLALVCGFISTPPAIKFLKRVRAYRADRKQTLYGEEATAFNALKQQEEATTKKEPVPRLGGITFFPAIILSIFFAFLFDFPKVFIVVMLMLLAVSVFTLYDDVIDVGWVAKKPFGFLFRLSVLFLIALTGGLVLQQMVPTTLTFLPFESFSHIEVGVLFGLFFALWYVFWQASSIIDGIDGLSGSIYLALFVGTGVVGLLQGQAEPYLLSSFGIGILVPFLYFNYPPAKLYLTEVGITVLTFLYASITFFLAVGSGGERVGLWLGAIFGLVLIGTWVSNVMQLCYRKKTGKKFFRVAPLHHHFECCGWTGKRIVSIYTSITVFCIISALTILFIL